MLYSLKSDSCMPPYSVFVRMESCQKSAGWVLVMLSTCSIAGNLRAVSVGLFQAIVQTICRGAGMTYLA